MDIKKFVDGLTFWLKAEISPLMARVTVLEERSLVHGKDGINGRNGVDGVNGKDADIEQIKALILEQTAQIPVPKDGKDADIDQIKQIITQEVAKIEPIAGAPGKDGVDGKNVDPEEVKSLIADVVAIAVQQVELPKAKDGKDGVDGKSIPTEDVQKMVDEAVSKAISAIKPAENGRDALDIEILPAIDEQKSYPRGTYALHKSGLFRSYQITSGMKGWECIVAGVDDIEIEQTDERSFTVKMIRSNGAIIDKSFSMPVMLYKNIYRPDKFYQKGDTATFGGSLWHCNNDTQEKPGTGCKDWSLIAKKGQDGKGA